MRLSHLETLIGAHGGDPARWPADARAAAGALLARSAEARALLADARALDRALAAWQPAPPAIDAAALAARATAAAQPRPAAAGRDWRIAIGWPRIAGLATACAVGFVLGWSGLVGGGPPADHGDGDGGTSLLAVERPIW
ncbi:MAG: hypothetical protein AB7K86_13085 [Rhodospirillales bacterium]